MKCNNWALRLKGLGAHCIFSLKTLTPPVRLPGILSEKVVLT